MNTNRRDFLRAAAAGLASAAALRSAASEALIEVLIDEPIATIAPEIYGHFVENLGGVVYDGIWVGEDSAIPNIGGLRKALVEALRRISPPVIRWPGDCFADSYDWRDGIGPRAKRPKRTNFWAGGDWPKGASRSGPQLRSQPVRHRRVCALREGYGRAALFRGQLARIERAGIRSLGGVLQLTGGRHYAGGAARVRRRTGALEHPLLGCRQ